MAQMTADTAETRTRRLRELFRGNYRRFAEYDQFFEWSRRLGFQNPQEAWQSNPLLLVGPAGVARLLERRDFPSSVEVVLLLDVELAGPDLIPADDLLLSVKRTIDKLLRQKDLDVYEGRARLKVRRVERVAPI